MNKENLNHNDCRNFIPIDVAKGFCCTHNKEIMIDGAVCPKFDAMPKCKNCSNFADVDEKAIGSCVGFKEKYWTYADLKAVSCEGFQAK